MALQHRVSRSYTDSTGVATTQTETVTGDSEKSYDALVPANQTNLAVLNFQVKQADLKSLLLYSDHAITIKTNSSGSPQDTIALLAGQAKVWTLATDLIGTCPFSNDVTELFLTNTTAANVKIRAITQD